MLDVQRVAREQFKPDGARTRVPVAQDDQWRHDLSHQPDDGSIDRLDNALARIAAAAGRRQDALRVAELTARAAQHEADMLVQAEQQRTREDVDARAASDALAAARQRDEMRALAARLEGLIAMVRAEVGEGDQAASREPALED